MKLGSAVWMEEGRERRALVTPLPSDPSRLVDLNRVEQLRLAKLGEGRVEALAEALVPSSLRLVLEGGARALQRLRVPLRYAEKWEARGGLPELLAPPLERVRLLPCLPRPALVRDAAGARRDRLRVEGPGATLSHPPAPGLAALGLRGGRPAGWCLALEDGERTIAGAWMVPDWPAGAELVVAMGGRRQRVPTDAWEGLELPPLRPGELRLLPPVLLRGRAVPGPLRLCAPFEALELELQADPLHPTLQ